MSIKARRNKQHLRFEFFKRRHPELVYRVSEGFATAASWQRNIYHALRTPRYTTVWVERVLEYRDHHDSDVVPKNIFRAIAVMHVEIDDRNTLQGVCFQGMGRTDGYVVEQAETHGPIALGMMSRGTNIAKSVLDFFTDYEVDCKDHRARGTISR